MQKCHLKFIILLLLVSNNLYSQFFLDSLEVFKSQKEEIVGDDYFLFEIAKIDSIYTNCIDSIISSYPLKKDYYWYLDFTKIEKHNRIILTSDNIERAVSYNELRGISNKCIIVNSLIVFIYEYDSTNLSIKSDNCVAIKNKKRIDLEIIAFEDISYWIFEVRDQKIDFVHRSIF